MNKNISKTRESKNPIEAKRSADTGDENQLRHVDRDEVSPASTPTTNSRFEINFIHGKKRKMMHETAAGPTP